GVARYGRSARSAAGTSIVSPALRFGPLAEPLMSKQEKTRDAAPPRFSQRLWPLRALNFFMADFQAGIGPFLGVFLQAHGWRDGLIGTVMTAGGVAGMLVIAPAGAMVDAT